MDKKKQNFLNKKRDNKDNLKPKQHQNKEKLNDTKQAQRKKSNVSEISEDKAVIINKKINKHETAKNENTENNELTNFAKDEITLREDTDVPRDNKQWRNRQRVLVVASRGVSNAERIIMNNIISLLPHSKKECKIERKVAIEELNEICFNHSCTNCVYFEHRKREFIMWVFRSPEGPTLKFQLNQIHALDEPKMAGNCLRYSRPLLNFDKTFDDETTPHLGLIKEMFVNVFNTPKNHPKSKPFYDHITSFMNSNNNIFFRNFQIVNDVKAKFCNTDDTDKLQLVEIGPRFSLKLIKIFDGTLGGKCLYTNPDYIPPAELIKKNALRFKERSIKIQKEKNDLNEKLMNSNFDIQERWINN